MNGIFSNLTFSLFSAASGRVTHNQMHCVTLPYTCEVKNGSSFPRQKLHTEQVPIDKCDKAHVRTHAHTHTVNIRLFSHQVQSIPKEHG